MARYNGNFVYGPSSLRPDYRDEPESSAPYPYMIPHSQYQHYQQLSYRKQHSNENQEDTHYDENQEDSHFHHGRPAARAWPTEIPTRLRVTICCEEFKTKLEQELNDLKGVFDVGIEGWTNAMVTVTGTAKKMNILKKARELSRGAELWDDSHSVDACYSNSCHRRHD